MEIKHFHDDPGTPRGMPSNTVLVCTWYESGDYDGWGTAWAKTVDEYCYYTTLGHCSCYGPFDENDSGDARGWDGPYSAKDMDMQLLGETGGQPQFREAFGFKKCEVS